MPNLPVNDLITGRELSRDDVFQLFRRTIEIKGKWLRQDAYEPLRGRTLVLIFEKPSLRTRLTFEIAAIQLGGSSVFLKAYPRESADIHLSEDLEDQGTFISRIADVVVMRTFDRRRIERMAEFSSVPVINGLSDDLHPCQALTDLYTILEEKGSLQGLKLAYVGDGGTNTAHSLLLLCAKLGVNIAVGCRKEYRPSKRYLDWAMQDAKTSGARIELFEDASRAVDDSDVIYTDTWVSMGRESEMKNRLSALTPYQVNRRLVAQAKPNVIVLHCLPAYRDREITSDVLTDPDISRVFEQAENRLHVQKAILSLLV
jgi:ornithine carbamoyltransferase